MDQQLTAPMVASCNTLLNETKRAPAWEDGGTARPVDDTDCKLTHHSYRQESPIPSARGRGAPVTLIAADQQIRSSATQ